MYREMRKTGQVLMPQNIYRKGGIRPGTHINVKPSVSILVHSHRLSVGTWWVVSIQCMSANSTSKQEVLWSWFLFCFLGDDRALRGSL